MSNNTQQTAGGDVPLPVNETTKFTYSKGQRKLSADHVIAEQPLQIRLLWGNVHALNSQVFSITMRTPGQDEQLIIGLLLSEGIIWSIKDIAEIVAELEQDEYANLWEVRLSEGMTPVLASLERYQVTYSSCGLCGATSLKSLELKNPPSLSFQPRWLSPDIVCQLAKIMRNNQTVFAKTGAAHAAALFDGQGQLINVKEDIGRHNAVDKLVGAMVQDDFAQKDKLCMVVSGRISFEIVQKTVMAGIPVLVAVGAPSELAIRAAKRFDLTLIGFATQDSFNLYHGEWRLNSMEDTCQKT